MKKSKVNRESNSDSGVQAAAAERSRYHPPASQPAPTLLYNDDMRYTGFCLRSCLLGACECGTLYCARSVSVIVF